MSILETLKQNNQPQTTATPTAAATPGLGRIQNLYRAKTGKAVSDTGPQASSLQAKIQEGQNIAQAEQGQQQANTLMMGLEQAEAGQEQKKEQQEQVLSQNLVEKQAEFTNRAIDTYREFSQKGVQLDNRRDRAKAEQLGFDLRLSNDKYITNLESQGRRARLDDAAGFQEELMRSIFGEELDMLNDSLDFRAMMSADEREFNDMMAAIDLDFAMQISKAENKAASNRMIWEGAGTAASGAARAYSSSDSSSDSNASSGEEDTTGSLEFGGRR